ncbi:MAG: hypothetical protein RL367_2614, partial [Pseudomonadota bacterium]
SMVDLVTAFEFGLVALINGMQQGLRGVDLPLPVRSP